MKMPEAIIPPTTKAVAVQKPKGRAIGGCCCSSPDMVHDKHENLQWASESGLVCRVISGTALVERWPLVQPFVISRETFEVSELIVVTLTDGVFFGRGEASPTSYFDETTDGALAEARAIIVQLGDTPWEALHDRIRPGAARNAVDCAMWDLRAKREGRRVWELIGPPAPQPLSTAMTIGIDTPARMAERAVASGHALIKLKLGSPDDLACVRAVRGALPDARIIVDANEAWSADALIAILPALAEAGVAMIEQPLHSSADAALAAIDRIVPVCADESCRTAADLDRLVGLYDVVNIKLDKTGGLTEALRLRKRARALGFDVMVGCMEATSLSMAPATLVAQGCAFVDLDGPLLIGRDRDHGLRYDRGTVCPPEPALWG
jgi:L-alanine-DL-glutamate epimerase-like enolase superfamily enzyme